MADEKIRELKSRDLTPQLMQEVSTSGDQDLTRGYTSGLLPIEDDVLDARGAGDLTLYEDVKRDDQCHACFTQRRRAVVSREWVVEPGGEDSLDIEAADFIREQLKAVGWDKVTDLMLWAVWYGYSVAEIVYKKGGRFYEWEAIKVRNRRRFGYDGDGGLRYLSRNDQNPGTPVGAPYFWDVCAGGDHSDAWYGLGLAHFCYWPVFFKRFAVKQWNVFLDRFASPSIIGKYPTGYPAAEQNRLLAAAKALRSEGAAIYPENVGLELLEASRTGTSDYMAAAKYHDGAIAKVILGQTMTTDDGSSRSQAEVHMDVRQDLVRADADLICESFSLGPIRWLCAMNFPNAMPPRVVRVIDDGEDLDKAAERDVRLASIGFKPTLEAVTERYGNYYVEARPTGGDGQGGAQDGADEPEAGAAQQFAGPEEPRDAADEITDQVQDLAPQVFDAFADQIAEMVEQVERDGGDLADVRDRLIEMAGGDFSDSELGAVLARAMMWAEVRGRVEVQEEAEE